MALFNNKYRIESARLQNWDYASEGAYFVTVCTKDRIHYFGEIENGKMIMSNVGILANVFWHEIKNHVKNVELGEFVVMPNHLHGVLILNDNVSHVETRHALSLQSKKIEQSEQSIGQQRFQNQGKNTISSIVGSYKSAVTKHANRLGLDFAWQSRFHDHIIRDDKSFNTITEYILNNPLTWTEDKFNKAL